MNLFGGSHYCGCSSRSNAVEAELALEVYGHVLPFLTGGDGEVAIITPYSQQREYIRRLLNKRFGDSARAVSVDTVDSFQGQEKEIVIISCVRSSGDIGFLRDPKRLNVALTRAKRALYVRQSSLRNHYHCLLTEMFPDLLLDRQRV